jgi:hypothetical protein
MTMQGVFAASATQIGTAIVAEGTGQRTLDTDGVGGRDPR